MCNVLQQYTKLEKVFKCLGDSPPIDSLDVVLHCSTKIYTNKQQTKPERRLKMEEEKGVGWGGEDRSLA